jgi:hypothetical protein
VTCFYSTTGSSPPSTLAEFRTSATLYTGLSRKVVVPVVPGSTDLVRAESLRLTIVAREPLEPTGTSSSYL